MKKLATKSNIPAMKQPKMMVQRKQLATPAKISAPLMKNSFIPQQKGEFTAKLESYMVHEESKGAFMEASAKSAPMK